MVSRILPAEEMNNDSLDLIPKVSGMYKRVETFPKKEKRIFLSYIKYDIGGFYEAVFRL